jgi:hypothetical protein
MHALMQRFQSTEIGFLQGRVRIQLKKSSQLHKLLCVHAGGDQLSGQQGGKPGTGQTLLNPSFRTRVLILSACTGGGRLSWQQGLATQRELSASCHGYRL